MVGVVSGQWPDSDAGTARPAASNMVAQPIEVWEDNQISFLPALNTIVRGKWLIGGAVLVSLVIGIIVTLLMTPIYVGRTTIQIDQNLPQVVPDQNDPTQTSGQEQFMATQLALLKSTSLAERVARNLNLGGDRTFLEVSGIGKGSVAGSLFGSNSAGLSSTAVERNTLSAVGVLSRNLVITPVPTSSIVQVGYDSPNPTLAATISNAFADQFLQAAIDRRYGASAYARNFLANSLNATKEKLEASERALVQYAVAQHIVNVPAAQSATGSATNGTPLDAANLSGANTAMIEATSNRIREEQKWEQAQATPDMLLPEVQASPAVNALKTARATVEAEYENKRSMFTPSYPEVIRLKAQLVEIDRQIAREVTAVRGSIRANYDIAQKQEQSLTTQAQKAQKDVLDLQNRSIQYNILQREVDTNRTLYDGLLQRYKEIGVAGGIGASNISVVDRARVPHTPDRPILWLNLAIAVIAGLVIGLLLAFGRELFRDYFKVPEDIESKLGIASLGSIPLVGDGESVQDLLDDTRSSFSEAYFSVRSAIKFASSNGAPRSVLITSTAAGEGKSTSSAAIALAFAGIGSRVLLVDADLRKPTVHRIFDVKNAPGLSGYLNGTAVLDDIIQPTLNPALFIVPSGPLPNSAAQLIASGGIPHMLKEASSKFDVVIIDGPPVIGLADAPLLASYAELTILIVQANSSRRGAVRRALNRLNKAHARIIGALLTKFDQSIAGYGYGYGYSSYYAYGSENRDERSEA